jgi:hypothetical protein
MKNNSKKEANRKNTDESIWNFDFEWADIDIKWDLTTIEWTKFDFNWSTGEDFCKTKKIVKTKQKNLYPK